MPDAVSNGGDSGSSCYPKPPPDVWEWVCETYDTEGVVIWLRTYQDGDDAKRHQLEVIARADGMPG